MIQGPVAEQGHKHRQPRHLTPCQFRQNKEMSILGKQRIDLTWNQEFGVLANSHESKILLIQYIEMRKFARVRKRKPYNDTDKFSRRRRSEFLRSLQLQSPLLLLRVLVEQNETEKRWSSANSRYIFRILFCFQKTPFIDSFPQRPLSKRDIITNT